MRYRPDVDGLRALAILFVLFFHSGLPIFPSGFIGVDIFFVISGFLISSLIHNSLENNQFSFVEFYSRRLWRLQPVLIFVLIVTTFLTLLFYLPDDLIQHSHSARKSTLLIANKFFAKVTADYFSPNSNQLALLHTWSLSIEWQCYLLLPLFIYLLHKLFSKPTIARILYLSTFIFFILTIYYSTNSPAKTYYQFLSRMFEFLIGSSIALGYPRFVVNKYILNSLSAVALFVLFYIATRHNISPGFPNWYALALCIATGILIATGTQQPDSLLTRCLSIKPLVFIGLISYSLYLWHWPLFALLRYQNVKETIPLRLIVIALSFILAYVSWRYIEKPARRLNQLKFSHSLIYLIILPIAGTHIYTFLLNKGAGIPQRFNGELVRIYEQLNQYESAKRPQCIGKKNIDIETQCRLGARNPDAKKGLLIGDSYANHYWGFMDVLSQQANLSLLAQATSSCLTLPGIYLYDWWTFNKMVYQECYDQTQRYYTMIKENHYDYVIIGQVWRNYLGDSIINQLNDQRSVDLTKQRISKALDEALTIIINSGATPVLIKATAASNDNLHDCFFNHIKQRKEYNPEQCNFIFQENRTVWLNQLFLKMKKKYPQLVIIDPVKVQCPGGLCKADINGVPVFRDIGHITDYASYQFAALYLQAYKNPLLRNSA